MTIAFSRAHAAIWQIFIVTLFSNESANCVTHSENMLHENICLVLVAN